MKHIISIILFLFLGFSPKSVAQTTNKKVTISSDTCLFHYFDIEYQISSTSSSVSSYLPLKTLVLDVPLGQYLHLKFNKTAAASQNPLNGVSVKDLVMLSNHILGIKSLTDGQLVAADVNNFGKITTSDFVETRKMILEQITTFTNNPSWLLYRRGISSNLGQDHGEKYLVLDNMFLFYQAIKIGDVSGNASCK